MADFDEDFGQYIPFDLFGSGSRIQQRKQDERDRENRYQIHSLINEGPTAEDLSVDYDQLGTTDEYGGLLGDGSMIQRYDEHLPETRRALQRLIEGGGYTSADRAAQNAAMAQNAQQVGSMNQAALRSQYARGMGGSGAELAAQLSGSQGLASANAQQQAQIQQAAMQRLMQGYGMQAQMSQVDLQRQQALDDYNQRQLDWRRGRSATNTGLANQSKESTAAARQTAYGNRERGTAMLSGQYQNENQGAQQQYQNRNQSSAALGNFISGLVGGVGQLANAGRRRSGGDDG
jgi:hypothetical protein